MTMLNEAPSVPNRGPILPMSVLTPSARQAAEPQTPADTFVSKAGQYLANTYTARGVRALMGLKAPATTGRDVEARNVRGDEEPVGCLTAGAGVTGAVLGGVAGFVTPIVIGALMIQGKMNTGWAHDVNTGVGAGLIVVGFFPGAEIGAGAGMYAGMLVGLCGDCLCAPCYAVGLLHD
jgi:hypothetical protein